MRCSFGQTSTLPETLFAADAFAPFTFSGKISQR
jgi:hypothetical protein